MLLHLQTKMQVEKPREVEFNLFMSSNANMLLYIEQCTAYISRLPEPNHTTVITETNDVSKMFKVEQQIASDSRHALSRCGRCKSTNVENIARQVRSADEGMSVFSTCLDCGNKWVQR